MIVKINGVPMENYPSYRRNELTEFVSENYTKKDIKQLRKLSIWLWSVSGMMLAQTPVFAAEGKENLWDAMKPIFGLFQEIGMVVGSLAIIGALIVMIFKKRLAVNIITTSALAIGGVFLVPSVVMLIAIIGSMMNSALSDVFSTLDIGGSIQVGN